MEILKKVKKDYKTLLIVWAITFAIEGCFIPIAFRYSRHDGIFLSFFVPILNILFFILIRESFEKERRRLIAKNNRRRAWVAENFGTHSKYYKNRLPNKEN